MSRVRTFYYDPAKLVERGDVADGASLRGGGRRKTVLQQAREALDGAPQPPSTPMEALMQARPGEEPETSAIERVDAFAPLHDAMESALTERERWIVEALFWRRLPLRSLGRELAMSKTQVARIRDNAIRKLAAALTVDASHLLGTLATEDD